MTKKKNKKVLSSSSSLSLSSSLSSSLLLSTTSSLEQVSQSLIFSSSSDEDKRIKPLDDESYKRIKREVFLVVDSEMNTVKINKKYKVTGAEIIKMLQRRHRSRHRVNNISNQGPRAVINDSRRKLKNTTMRDITFGHTGKPPAIPPQNTFNYLNSYQKGYQLFMIYSLLLKKPKRNGEGYEFNEYHDPFSNVNQA
ncbi:hypothetical protein Glove_21g396 [Diversispora epigaea]|uniref:Uncharacterized protein n=1 Tax=Diversispora epigaea TaxID=1348612 RepID=A0A397JK18_9GLOM|nr:hypothetical protein Glove_21g396 [Diversispora epigaea]